MGLLLFPFLSGDLVEFNNFLNLKYFTYLIAQNWFIFIPFANKHLKTLYNT